LEHRNLTEQVSLDQPYVIDLLSTKPSPADVDILLNRIPAGDFRRATEIVLICAESFLSLMADDRARPAREAALERIDKPILLLAYDAATATHRLSRMSVSGLMELPQPATAVSRIREYDLARMGR
jgi:hypothetical protein